jgi:uncharacterized membrane protein HdeD (DUF308 family)
MALGLTLPMSGIIAGIISIIFGVLVMAFPKLLRFVVGIYFILMGILALLAAFL